MPRDQLFLLKPDFRDGDREPLYCPACATLEGVLAFYPRLRERVDVEYVEFPRPRAAVVAVLGARHQGLPALVVGAGGATDAVANEALAGLDVRESAGRRFLQGPGDIGRYLARRYGIGEPH